MILVEHGKFYIRPVCQKDDGAKAIVFFDDQYSLEVYHSEKKVENGKRGRFPKWWVAPMKPL